MDYISNSTNQTFPSGSSDGATGCLNIAILEDEALEGNQTFTVMVTTSDPNVKIEVDTAVVTIVDNDG